MATEPVRLTTYFWKITRNTVAPMAKTMVARPISLFSMDFGLNIRSADSISRNAAEPLMKAA